MKEPRIYIVQIFTEFRHFCEHKVSGYKLENESKLAKQINENKIWKIPSHSKKIHNFLPHYFILFRPVACAILNKLCQNEVM